MARSYKRGIKVNDSDKKAKSQANRKYRRKVNCRLALYTILITVPDKISEDGNLMPQKEIALPTVREISNTWADFPSEGMHHRFAKPSRWLAKGV